VNLSKGHVDRIVLSPQELVLLARLVHAEAAGEPFQGKVAVAATVLNRLKDKRFPNTIREIIYQQVNGIYQYTPVQDGRINLAADRSAFRAVRAALRGEDPSGGALGFYNPALTNDLWVRSQEKTIVIGNHVFFRW
jgi:N-acetylmuramoyl-L-alanine amidase